MTNFDCHDLAGNTIGPWHQPDCDQAFVAALKQNLSTKFIREVDLHINDAEFSAELLATFMSLMTVLLWLRVGVGDDDDDDDGSSSWRDLCDC